jgi:dihydroflavonol-4-reductase
VTKSAFVTGGTGFLGRHLVEQLCAAGWTVTCFHRDSSDVSALKALPVSLRAGILHDPKSVAAAMPQAVDVIFHVAANTSPWKKNAAVQTRDNVEGTRAVIAAALEKDATRLVVTSSWAAYGLALGDQPALTEESPLRGGESWINYERTKYLAETEALAATARGLEVVVLEPPHIMGKYDTVNWSRLIAMAHQGTLPGIPPGSGQFASGADVARSHIAAAEQGKSGERYLLPGAQATFLDVVKIVCELAGRPVTARVMPGFLISALAHAKAAVAIFTGKEPDITPESARMTVVNAAIVSHKAEEQLGHRVGPLREMVEESYRWLKEAGLLEKKV